MREVRQCIQATTALPARGVPMEMEVINALRRLFAIVSGKTTVEITIGLECGQWPTEICNGGTRCPWKVVA